MDSKTIDVLLRKNSSVAALSTKAGKYSGELENAPVLEPSGSQKNLSSSFAGLSLSARQRTRFLIEVTAFVSAVSNIKHGPEHYGSDVVPDKELSLAVDILRRTRNMIRNRFTGALAEKSCELPARVTFSQLRARNLEPRDYKHNPGSYCVMKMDGLMYRTSSHKSLNPIWDEEFEFIVQDVDSVMSISVWDDFVDANHSDHAFGKAYLFTSELLRAEPCFFEKKLLDSLGNHAGFIGMRLQCEEMDSGGIEESPDCSAVEVAALTRILWILGVPKELCIQIIRMITRVVSPRETIEILGPVQTHIAVHLCEHFWIAEIFSHWKAYLMTQRQRKAAARMKFEQEQYLKTNRWDVRVKKLQEEITSHNVADHIKKYLEANTMTSSDEENLRLARDFIKRTKPPVADPEKAASLAAKFQSLDPPDGVLAGGQVRHARDIVAELLALFEREALFFHSVQAEVMEILRRMQSEQSADAAGRADPDGEGYAALWASIRKRCAKDGRSQEEAQADFLASKKFRITKHIRQAAAELWSFLCGSRQRHVRRDTGLLILKVVQMEKARVEEQAAAERRRLRILGDKADLRTLEMRGAQDRAVNACMSWLVLHEERVVPAVRDELVQLISHFRENLAQEDAEFQEREETLVQIRALKDAEVLRLSEHAKLGLVSRKKSMTPAEASAASAHLLALFRSRSERPGRDDVGSSALGAEDNNIADLTEAMMGSEELTVVAEDADSIPIHPQNHTETPRKVAPNKPAAKRKKKKKTETSKAGVPEERNPGKGLRTAGSPPVRKAPGPSSVSRKIGGIPDELTGSVKSSEDVRQVISDTSLSINLNNRPPTMKKVEPVADVDEVSVVSEHVQNKHSVDIFAVISKDVSDLEGGSAALVESQQQQEDAAPTLQVNDTVTKADPITVEPELEGKLFLPVAIDNQPAESTRDHLATRAVHLVPSDHSETNPLKNDSKRELNPRVQHENLGAVDLLHPVRSMEPSAKRNEYNDIISQTLKPHQEKIEAEVKSSSIQDPEHDHKLKLNELQPDSESVPENSSMEISSEQSQKKPSDFAKLELDDAFWQPPTTEPNMPCAANATNHVYQITESEGENTILTSIDVQGSDQTYDTEEQLHAKTENPAQLHVNYSTDSEEYSDSSDSDKIDWLVVEEGLRNFADHMPASQHYAQNRSGINSTKAKAIFSFIRHKSDDWESSYCQGVGLHRQAHLLPVIVGAEDNFIQVFEHEASNSDDLEYEEFLRFQAAARSVGMDSWFANSEGHSKPPTQLASYRPAHIRQGISSGVVRTESELFLLSQYAYQRYLRARSQLPPRSANTAELKRAKLKYKFVSYLIDQDMLIAHNVVKGQPFVVWRYKWTQLHVLHSDQPGNMTLFVQREHDSTPECLFTLNEVAWLKFNQLRSDILDLKLPKSSSSPFFPLGEPKYVGSTTEIFVVPSRFGYDFHKYSEALTHFSRSNLTADRSPIFVTQLNIDHGEKDGFAVASNFAQRPINLRKICILQSTFRRKFAAKALAKRQDKNQIELFCCQVVWGVVDRVLSAFQATNMVLASLSSESAHSGQEASNFVFNVLPMHALDPSVGLDVATLVNNLTSRQFEKEAEQVLRLETQRIQSSIEDSRRLLRKRTGFVARNVLPSQERTQFSLVGRSSPRRDRLNPGDEVSDRFPQHRRWDDHEAEYFVENRGRLIHGQAATFSNTRSIPAVELSKALKRSHGHVYRQPDRAKQTLASPRWPSNQHSTLKHNPFDNVGI